MTIYSEQDVGAGEREFGQWLGGEHVAIASE